MSYFNNTELILFIFSIILLIINLFLINYIKYLLNNQKNNFYSIFISKYYFKCVLDSLEETVEVFLVELSEYFSKNTLKCKIGVIFMQLNPKTNLYYPISEECIFEYDIENPISTDELLSLINWKIFPLIIVKDVKILFRFY